MPDPVRLSAGGVPGSELSVQALMDLAQQIADGETTEAEAVAKARVLITEATTPR